MKPKRMLVNQLDFDQLTGPQIRWVVTAVAGALIADGVLSEGERPHLEALLDLTREDENLKELIDQTLLSGVAPQLDNPSFAPDVALLLYKIALEISCADLELHPHELKYLATLATRLNIGHASSRPLIKTALQGIRIDQLVTNKDRFTSQERAWLATVIVQLAWADGVVENRELKFLSHVFELLENQPQQLKQLRTNPANADLHSLPAPKFDPAFAQHLARYLIEMTIGAVGLETFGLEVAQLASEQLGINSTEFESLVVETQDWLNP